MFPKIISFLVLQIDRHIVMKISKKKGTLILISKTLNYDFNAQTIRHLEMQCSPAVQRKGALKQQMRNVLLNIQIFLFWAQAGLFRKAMRRPRHGEGSSGAGRCHARSWWTHATPWAGNGSRMAFGVSGPSLTLTAGFKFRFCLGDLLGFAWWWILGGVWKGKKDNSAVTSIVSMSSCKVLQTLYLV